MGRAENHRPPNQRLEKECTMNRSVVILALVFAPLVSGTTEGAEPWSSATGSAHQTADRLTIENCQTLLNNNSYSCKVKSSFGTTFTDTFTFTSPGVTSAHFDLAVAQIPFQGQVRLVGVIKPGSAANSFGDTFVFKCALAP